MSQPGATLARLTLTFLTVVLGASGARAQFTEVVTFRARTVFLCGPFKVSIVLLARYGANALPSYKVTTTYSEEGQADDVSTEIFAGASATYFAEMGSNAVPQWNHTNPLTLEQPNDHPGWVWVANIIHMQGRYRGLREGVGGLYWDPEVFPVLWTFDWDVELPPETFAIPDKDEKLKEFEKKNPLQKDTKGVLRSPWDNKDKRLGKGAAAALEARLLFGGSDEAPGVQQVEITESSNLSFDFSLSRTLGGRSVITFLVSLDDPTADGFLIGNAYPDPDAADPGRRTSFLLIVAAQAGTPLFRRSDSDASGILDITDAISLLSYLFLGGATPSCPDAADANDSSKLDISDATFILGFQFQGGPDPPPPGAFECGSDPTADDLGECVYPSC